MFEETVPREGLLVSHVINLIYKKVFFQTLGVVPKLVGDRVVLSTIDWLQTTDKSGY